jgi:hypothetical protein
MKLGSKMMKLFRLLILLVVTMPAFATTFYVAKSGSDSNPGTLASPWLTIQHAADTVNAGDTAIVGDGTYTGAACTAGENSGQGLVSVSHSGAPGNYITFKSQNKWGAVLQGNTTSATSGCAEGWRLSGSYIRIQDFDMRGFADDAVDNYPGGQFINIVGNHIHDIGRYCTRTGIGRDAIFLSNPNVTIEQNTINDIGRYAPNENGCVNPLNYQQNDHGIYVDGASGVMIRNNIFYRVEHGYSVQVYPSNVDSLSVLNNTFVWGDAYGYAGFLILSTPGITNFRIENNIAYSAPANVFVRFATTTGYTGTIANNVTYNGTISDVTPSGVTLSGNLNDTDPALASVGSSTIDNASVPDVHLTSGSPAIHAGLVLPDVPNDYSGDSRPQGAGYDVGAFEFLAVVSPNPPSPPTNLTATAH